MNHSRSESWSESAVALRSLKKIRDRLAPLPPTDSDMSFIELNTDAQQYRVVIPRCKSLPPNPHIGDGLETVDRALQASHTPPSETGDSELTPESRDDKRLRNHLLAIDQRSFFTGSAAADLQAAHMISPIRRNVERKHQVVSLTFSVSFSS